MWDQRSTPTRLIFMILKVIDKAISAATDRRRLHTNGLYTKAPRVYILLSVQFWGERLNCCCHHMNWTVSNKGNVMAIYESSLALKAEELSIRVRSERFSCSEPRTSPYIKHFPVEASWSRTRFHWDITPVCTFTSEVL